MTNAKYDKLVTRIFWFALPLIISLLTFLVVNTFSVKEEVAKVSVKEEASYQTQEKMWALVQENNKILNLKADEKSNEEAHHRLMVKLDNVEYKVSTIYSQKHQLAKVDTIVNCGAEILRMATNTNKKVDTIQNLLENNKQIYTRNVEKLFTKEVWKNITYNKTKK